MRLLLDQGTPRTAAGRLRDNGVDAIPTGEIGLATASDAEVLERARSEERTLFTLDADFHRLLARSHTTAPSVVRLRIEGLRSEEMADLILQVIAACADDLARGAVVSVGGDRRIRIRWLPL